MLVEPAHVTDGLADTPVNNPASILARFKSYDTFEKCDFSLSLSRLVIESLVHPDLCAEFVVQHNYIANFKKLPSQIYLMMLPRSLLCFVCI